MGLYWRRSSTGWAKGSVVPGEDLYPVAKIRTSTLGISRPFVRITVESGRMEAMPGIGTVISSKRVSEYISRSNRSGSEVIATCLLTNLTRLEVAI